jgi:hypothetical protein
MTRLDARLWHPWLGINRVLRVMLQNDRALHAPLDLSRAPLISSSCLAGPTAR